MMKSSMIVLSSATLLLNSCGTVLSGEVPATKSSVVTLHEALTAIQSVKPPAGVTFIGSAEPLKKTVSMKTKEADDKEVGNEHQEQWLGGWGGFGGFGGFGAYRFGFMCGGLPGWAYPLSFWNLYGYGLYGGGCGLGLAYGGLFYC